jgi:hypothetical protein
MKIYSSITFVKFRWKWESFIFINDCYLLSITGWLPNCNGSKSKNYLTNVWSW